jgi:hypothetical protein
MRIKWDIMSALSVAASQTYTSYAFVCYIEQSVMAYSMLRMGISSAWDAPSLVVLIEPYVHRLAFEVASLGG